jgi:flavin reductase (DIM6/NTAB) family NADH-FMN oxidoreductase RutF/DNA-binding IclR family transcriptional regulator
MKTLADEAGSPGAPSISEFTAADLRRCLGEFVTGVTVVTAIGPDGLPCGLTANSFSSVSLDPPLILWSLRFNATNFAIFSAAEFFAVNILAEDQVEVSNRFAKSGPDRFAGISVSVGAEGVPLLDGAVAQLECKKEASYPGGDHLVFIGRVLRIRGTDRKPLALRRGTYMTVHPHITVVPAEGDEGSLATMKAVHAARPVVEELARETDRSVGLGVWGNLGPTMIWWCEGTRQLPTKLRCGQVVKLLGSATGGAFAAFAPPDITRPFIEAELEASSKGGLGSSLKTRSEVECWLDGVRQEGLASAQLVTNPGVNDQDIASFSAPVFDAQGNIVLAITMMGESKYFDARDPGLIRLRRAAASLSERFGLSQGRQPS